MKLGWGPTKITLLSLSVDPGEHHLCANRQSRIDWLAQLVAVAHFNAEAGKTYYFRTRTYEIKNQVVIDLDSIDIDQGQYFVSTYAVSVSHAKP